MNFADIISSAWGFSPLDSIFVLAVLALIAAGLKKNHGLKKEERELTEKIASFMTETGTKGLGNLKCTLYTDGTYTTQESYGSVHPGDYIYWTTSAGSRTWHHQGQAVATETAHPNRS